MFRPQHRTRLGVGLLSGGLALLASGCSTTVAAHGTSHDVFDRTQAALLRSGFQIEKGAKGTYGARRELGQIDVNRVEDRDVLQARRFVSVTITPYGDDHSIDRKVNLHGWKYSWFSVVTLGAYTSYQPDIETLAAKAVAAEFSEFQVE